MNKSLKEVESIIERFPEASGVGYVVAPVILKLGADLRISGYGDALIEWLKSKSLDQKVFGEGEKVPDDFTGVLIGYDSPSLTFNGSYYKLGIKAAISELQELVK